MWSRENETKRSTALHQRSCLTLGVFSPNLYWDFFPTQSQTLIWYTQAWERRVPPQINKKQPTFGTGMDQLWIDFEGSLYVFMNYRGVHITPQRRGKSQCLFGKGTEFNKWYREGAACMWFLVQHRGVSCGCSPGSCYLQLRCRLHVSSSLDPLLYTGGKLLKWWHLADSLPNPQEQCGGTGDGATRQENPVWKKSVFLFEVQKHAGSLQL